MHNFIFGVRICIIDLISLFFAVILALISIVRLTFRPPAMPACNRRKTKLTKQMASSAFPSPHITFGSATGRIFNARKMLFGRPKSHSRPRRKCPGESLLKIKKSGWVTILEERNGSVWDWVRRGCASCYHAPPCVLSNRSTKVSPKRELAALAQAWEWEQQGHQYWLHCSY